MVVEVGLDVDPVLAVGEVVEGLSDLCGAIGEVGGGAEVVGVVVEGILGVVAQPFMLIQHTLDVGQGVELRSDTQTASRDITKPLEQDVAVGVVVLLDWRHLGCHRVPDHIAEASADLAADTAVLLEVVLGVAFLREGYQRRRIECGAVQRQRRQRRPVLLDTHPRRGEFQATFTVGVIHIACHQGTIHGAVQEPLQPVLFRPAECFGIVSMEYGKRESHVSTNEDSPVLLH